MTAPEGRRLVVADGVPCLALRWRDVPAALGVSETKLRELEGSHAIVPFWIDGSKFVDPQDLIELVAEAKRRGHLDSRDFKHRLRIERQEAS